MNEWKLPWEGACRCGQVRFEITVPPLLIMACHCKGCQRMSASAYSLSAAIPTQGFVVTRGAPVIGGLHGASRHHFCPHCKSWLFTNPEGIEQFVNVRPTMLEEASWVQPFIETWTRTRLPSAFTGANYSYETFPPLDDYTKLVDEFAQHGARPGQR